MPSLLYTDRYCPKMGQKFWRLGRNDMVSFESFTRSLPPNRGYLINAGLGTVLWWLENLTFDRDDYDYLVDIGFDPKYANWLYEKANTSARFFTGDVWAIPEGMAVPAQTPVLRVTAPRIEATLIESLLLSIVNQQTMVASKAHRIVRAANGKPVIDMSLRRLHGPEASVGVARGAYIAGVDGTATLEAGRKLDIPTFGTMAHADIMSYEREDELQAFIETLQEFPEDHALLLDTYDTILGCLNAITASDQTGIPLKAVRLDSGDMVSLSESVRAVLDDYGLTETKIIASSDLDEYEIKRFEDAGTPTDSYGVGTRLGTVPDAPNIGGVYKLVEQHERDPRYVMKSAPGKGTDPGIHQIWGYFPDSLDLHLSLFDEEKRIDRTYPLMEQVMKSGRKLDTKLPDLDNARMLSRGFLLNTPEGVGDFDNPSCLKLTRSDTLWNLRAVLGDTEAMALRDKERNG